MSFENFIYVKTLDLRIVSHGGVGSNYLVDYLTSKGLYVKGDQFRYFETCHSPYVVDVPTIFIYGDYVNAICSMYQRGCLNVNATKMHLDRDCDYPDLYWFLDNYPDDPIGIKSMKYEYLYKANWIRYPYTKERIERMLKSCGFNIDCSDMVIKKRKSNLDKILKVYEN